MNKQKKEHKKASHRKGEIKILDAIEKRSQITTILLHLFSYHSNI